MNVVPAIIPTSLEDLKNKLGLVSFAKAVQIDLVDGQFVPSTAWPYLENSDPKAVLPFISNREIEVDLMVADPYDAALLWLSLGAKRIVFHIENLVQETRSLVALREKDDVQLGIAINNDTPLEQLAEYANQIDFIQVMGIATIGKQGEPFDERTFDRIKTIRATYPELSISVDGAVSMNNIKALKESGATRFTVGSALLKSQNPEATYEELLKIATN